MPTSGATAAAGSFSKSSTSISSRRKPFLFLSNLWRRKKVLEIDDIIFDRELNHRTRSEPSVISYSCTSSAMMTNTPASNPAHNQFNNRTTSTLTMTPGRCRDIDQDMHALRLSRQDNPFVQKVLASRESLIDTLDIVSDDAILMASEENPECDSDPFAMPEVQEHMIRSPPPTSWPRSPGQYMFSYNQDNNNFTISSHSSDDEEGGYNSQQSIRAQDFFMRTTSVPSGPVVRGNASESSNSNNGLNIALSRPKSNSVHLSSQFGSSAGGLAMKPLGGSQLVADSDSDSSMILRPKCLYEPLNDRNCK